MWTSEWFEEQMYCCSSENLCGISEGNCVEDKYCLGHLLCGDDNCFPPFPSDANCCYDPTPSKDFLDMNFIPSDFIYLIIHQICLHNLILIDDFTFKIATFPMLKNCLA